MDERGGAGELSTVYAEANNNFRTLTDIRFKLLAFLPLGTGVAVLTGAASKHAGAAVLGAIVTSALWAYDQRNNQLYDELVGEAANLERRMGLSWGPFISRPRPWLRLLGVKIEHGWPVGLVYGCCFASFLAVMLQHLRNAWSWGRPADLALWLAAAAITSGLSALVGLCTSRQRRTLRSHVRIARGTLAKRSAATHLAALAKPAPVPDQRGRPVLRRLTRRVARCCEAGVKVEAVLKRKLEKIDDSQVELGIDRASTLLAEVSKLPRRWIRWLPARDEDPPVRTKTTRFVLCLVLLTAAALASRVFPAQPTKETANRDVGSHEKPPTSIPPTVICPAPVVTCPSPVVAYPPAPSPATLAPVAPNDAEKLSRVQDEIRQKLDEHRSSTSRSVPFGLAGAALILAACFLYQRNKLMAAATGAVGVALSVGSFVDIAKDSEFTLLKLDIGKLSGELTFSPAAPPALPLPQALQYRKIGETKVFEVGLDKPEVEPEFDLDLAGLLEGQCSPYAFIILFGRADIRELTSERSRPFVTNRNLAEKRAEHVQRKIRRISSCSAVPVIVIPSGPYDLGARGNLHRLAADRKVELLGIVRAGG